METLVVSRYTYLLPFVLLVSLTGCCGVPVPSTLSPTNSPASPTAMPLPTVAPSLTPTLELPTDTHTPSLIPPTRTPRPTPVPTMTADEEYGFFLEMLQNNGGCQLPCWWGFTPGETSWQATRDFFTSLGKETGSVDGIQNYTVFFNRPGHYESYQSYIGGEDGILEMIGIVASPAVGEDGLFTYDHPQFAEDWRTYMLPQMLEVYGSPSQVFLGTGGAPWSPFDLLLFYPEKGFLMQYSGVAEEREGETWLVCPHLVELTLYLWSPDRSMNLEDIPGVIDVHADDPTWGPYSLEEATGMSIEQFYETFVKSDNETCLEVPADLW